MLTITRLSDGKQFDPQKQHDLQVLIAQEERARGYNYNNRWDLEYSCDQWWITNASRAWQFWLDPSLYSVTDSDSIPRDQVQKVYDEIFKSEHRVRSEGYTHIRFNDIRSAFAKIGIGETI